MTRIKDISITENDYNVDPILPIFLGLFKPVIGGALGIFTVALLSTEIISIGTNSNAGSKECLFFSIAFVVGFSERLAKDVIKRTEDLVSPQNYSSQPELTSNPYPVANQAEENPSLKQLAASPDANA